VRRLLSEAPPGGPAPAAIIAPHAGYRYSGPIAASAFRCAAARRDRIRRVVLLGPSHYVAFAGLAASGASAFSTPLGAVEVDTAAEEALVASAPVDVLERAHAPEHCLEVELPFLQVVLGAFSLVALLSGDCGVQETGRVLEALWTGDDTLVVVSSDLSHYHDYPTATRLDAATARAIEELRWEAIAPDDACGAVAVRALLWVARRRGLRATTLDLRNSGDTGGPRDRVVGYGAWALL